MRLADIFSKVRLSHNKAEGTSTSNDYESGGKLYALWLMVLPLLLGFSLGRLVDAGLGYGLEALSGNNGVQDAAVTGTLMASDTGNERRGLEGFLAANPFRISPQKADVPAPEPPKPQEEEKPKEPDPTLDGVILRGTLPNVGAWLEVKNVLKLVLIGRELDSYKLQSVNYREAVFRKGNEKPVTKYLTYGPLPEAKDEEAPKPSTPSRRAAEPPKQTVNTGNIVAAVPGSQEGQVSSEMVNNLVQNPFDELKRIRIRPNEKAGGLEVQWIQNDSLLKRLGVQKGDVIKSVNGIPFTNMGDIANSISSLMTSERFDVEVTRGGKPTALRYVVR